MARCLSHGLSHSLSGRAGDPVISWRRPAFEIVDAADGLDAIELCRPDGFAQGTIVLFLGHDRVPVAALAVDGAPSDDTERLPALLAETLQPGTAIADATASVVVGVVRDRESSRAPGDISVGLSECLAWLALSSALESVGVELVDVVVLEPSGWTALSVHEVAS